MDCYEEGFPVMSKVNRCALIVLATLATAGCVKPEGHTYRPNRDLDNSRFTLQCDGDFDQAPELLTGKSPVFPARMLNPDVIEDRKIRHLPMEWPAETTFEVTTDGRTLDVRSSPTEPPSFASHMTIAVREWRFSPATQQGTAVASRCSTVFRFGLN